MKKNFDDFVKELDGASSLDENGRSIKICQAIAQALSGFHPHEEPQPSANEKIERVVLAYKVFPGGDLDLTIEELAAMKKVCLIAWPSPLMIYQIKNAIDKEG